MCCILSERFCEDPEHPTEKYQYDLNNTWPPQVEKAGLSFKPEIPEKEEAHIGVRKCLNTSSATTTGTLSAAHSRLETDKRSNKSTSPRVCCDWCKNQYI
ncbi:hypothetical protein CEXT_501771 [Caerostris extrusa]|uniref:Uncharacterized protein n=1 Tax=Caerostris extrusa TaxID=172846 RepID=A0AAV4P7B9_CAEEX|nr:hypothetical protein CEXT_501771 [Caerostris extrusa]